MMGERTVMQEALFYSFRIEEHVPGDHLLRSIDRHPRASEAVLQRDGAPLDRSRADDPDADRGLLHGYSVGAAAVRRGSSQPRLSLVLPA